MREICTYGSERGRHAACWVTSLLANSASSAKTAALLGTGIHINLPSLHCYRDIEFGTLVPLLKGWEQPSLPLYIYSRPECVKLARVRLFIRRFREVMFGLHRKCADVLTPWVSEGSRKVLEPVPVSDIL